MQDNKLAVYNTECKDKTGLSNSALKTVRMEY